MMSRRCLDGSSPSSTSAPAVRGGGYLASPSSRPGGRHGDDSSTDDDDDDAEPVVNGNGSRPVTSDSSVVFSQRRPNSRGNTDNKSKVQLFYSAPES